MSIEDKPGFKNAFELLSKMTHQEQKRIIDSIEKLEPKLARALRSSFYQIDDLQYLNPGDLARLLQGIDISTFSTALRGANDETRKHVISNVSSRMKDEIEESIHGAPQAVERVTAAIDVIIAKLIKKVETGEISLIREDNDQIID